MMVTGSFIAVLVILLVAFAMLSAVFLLRKRADLRIRGVPQTIEIGLTTALLASTGMMVIVDEPFLTCLAFGAYSSIAVVLVWPSFILYICRFSRLFHINNSSETRSITSDESTASLRSSIVNFTLVRTNSPRFALRVRLYTIAFIAAAALTLIFYAENNRLLALSIPGSFSECGDDQGLFFGTIFILMGMEAAIFGIIILGLVLDLTEQVHHRGDALGIRSMLRRMAFTAFASMISFVVVCVLYGLLVLPLKFMLFNFVPFIFFFWVDLAVVPVIRAIAHQKYMRDLRKKNGLLPAREILHGDNEKPLRLFRAFILSDEGFFVFRDHLQSEFGLEALSFIVDASRFAADFKTKVEQSYDGLNWMQLKEKLPRMNMKNSRRARYVWDAIMAPAEFHESGTDIERRYDEIVKTYLSANAPMQINIPHDMASKFHGSIQGDNALDNLMPDVFDEVVDHVLEMLFFDSFQRFLEDLRNAERWERFKRADDELRVLDEESKINC